MDGVLNPTIAGGVSLFLPLIIDFVNVKVKSSRARYWIAITASVLIGGASSFIGGIPSPDILLASIGTSFAVAQTVYNQYWKDSSRRKVLTTELKNKM
jgi:hypothetical protein